MAWFARSVPCVGSVWFRGTLSPRLENFAGVAKQGIVVQPAKAQPGVHWAAVWRHPHWGPVHVECRQDMPRPPPDLIRCSASLTDEEREDACQGGAAIVLRLDGERKHVLRDRKHFLRFLRVALGQEGVLALDHGSWLAWSRTALDEELVHDADVDIEALYCLHAVSASGGGAVNWLHSHGLDRIGGFDFDILRPGEDLLDAGQDVLRAIAYAIAEGRVSRTTARYRLAEPGGAIRFVECNEFEARADSHFTTGDLARDPDHRQNRAVLCDPAHGLFGRWGRRMVPSRFLSQFSASENLVVDFSEAATKLMAERARHTYSLLRTLASEFEEFEFPCLVKLGYGLDGPGLRGEEHLWFSVHTFRDDQVDATLENEPVHVNRLKRGARAWHPVDLISDWAIMTPVGSITPRHILPARHVRAKREEVRALMREYRADCKRSG